MSRRPAPRSVAVGVRADIQGLRAVAVTLVVVYHLWPGAVPGGFVGVDVFFVISGFLITTHLIERAPRGPRGVLSFWGRRIRRLLPASLTVLAATALASWFILPGSRWQPTLGQIRAAALYIVNWKLAHDAVDYLDATAAASPVQHFWSLAVEEQFYFAWPILILLLGLLARLTRLHRLVWYAVGLGAITAASLICSVHETATKPAAAYFVTQTRIWELGVGGLVAVLVASGRTRRWGSRPRALLAWLGCAGIVVIAFRYGPSTPFPGWQASLPVAATAVVIVADASRRTAPVHLLAWKPIQWLGDTSYSIYLWHWPLIVLLPLAVHLDTTRLDLLILVATLVLSALSKRFIEDVFRRGAWSRDLALTYLSAATLVAVVAAIAGSLFAKVGEQDQQVVQKATQAVDSGTPCLGAGVLDPTHHCAARQPMLLTPAAAASDRSDAYATVHPGENCWANAPHFTPTSCLRGQTAAPVTVALVGNSHAAQWLPALEKLATEHHWQIVARFASACAVAEVPQDFGSKDSSLACQSWARTTAASVAAAHPDLVIVSDQSKQQIWGTTSATQSTAAYVTGYEAAFRTWTAAGIPVLAIRDTPAPDDEPHDPITAMPDCIAAHGSSSAACTGARSSWLLADPALTAASRVGSPLMHTVDMTRWICPGTRCQGVVGGVIVWFDNSHLTATYAATMAPYLDPAVEAALAKPTT